MVSKTPWQGLGIFIHDASFGCTPTRLKKVLALQPPPGFRIIFPATACVFFVLFQSHQFRGHFHHNQLSVVTGGANSLVRVDSRKRKIKHEKNHEKDLCKASRLPWDPFRCQTVVSDCAAHRVWSESCACAARHCGTWLLCTEGWLLWRCARSIWRRR